MTDADLAATIDAAWEARDQVSPHTKGAWRDAVMAALDGLDDGKLRVAEPSGEGRGWRVHQWLKKAVLLSFRLNDMVEIPGGPVGRNCHLSGGVGIGGVLEPLQAEPVIIEDDCFIGARSEVVEGVIVEQGAVLAMGTFISSTTKIVNRDTGEVHLGRVPAYSVVVPGSLPGRALPDGSPGPSLYCAVIVKQVDAQTRAKTAINELLRL